MVNMMYAVIGAVFMVTTMKEVSLYIE